MKSEFILPKHKPRDEIIGKVARFLAALPEQKSWRVTVGMHISSRTNQQNRYLFGIAYPILSAHTGYTVDDLHEYCCGQFFGWKSVKCPRTENNPGGVKDVPIRTTTRDDQGYREVIGWDVFSDFVESVQTLGAKAGVYIPDPDPELRAA